MLRKELKQKAKNQLGNSIFDNKWLMALLVCLIVSGLTSISGSAFAGIIAIIIGGPLQYGLSYIFLKQSRDNNAIELEDIFKGFKEDFPQNILLSLMSEIFIILWTLLFIIPGIIKSYSYSMAYFIKVDNPDYDWKKCLEESTRITNGHKMDLFILDLSFIGWFIVGLLCLGIGVLWVIPYIYATKTHFYESIKNC